MARDTKPEPEILLSDSRGIYIPRDFVEVIHRENWIGISDEDIEILSDPEHEYYWEAWQSVCDDAIACEDSDDPAWVVARDRWLECGSVHDAKLQGALQQVKATTYTLYQDGDLWQIPRDMVWHDRTEWFIRPLTRAQVTEQASIEIERSPEIEPIEGFASAIDEETDREIAASIRTQLADGNDWAWCSIVVSAELTIGREIFRGDDSLGCCSYASEADFRECGYFADMRENALRELCEALERDGLLADDPPAEVSAETHEVST